MWLIGNDIKLSVVLRQTQDASPKDTEQSRSISCQLSVEKILKAKNKRRNRELRFTPLAMGRRRHPTSVFGNLFKDFIQSSILNHQSSTRGFTFVELMLSVVILMTGLVLIIQGFIIATSALNAAQSRINAIQFIDAKLQDIEALARKDDGVKRYTQSGDFLSLSKVFNWKLDVGAVEKTEPIDLSADLNELSLNVSWQERNLSKNLSVATYLRNKKE
jgi:type II secretory pathway pseudopilin PulG